LLEDSQEKTATFKAHSSGSTGTILIRRSSNFDLNSGVVQLTHEKLTGFLDGAELAQIEVKLEGGKINFVAPESVLEKIAQHFG